MLGVHFNGQSSIVSAAGETLAAAGQAEVSLLVADVVRRSGSVAGGGELDTQDLDYLRDRRPQLYRTE